MVEEEFLTRDETEEAGARIATIARLYDQLAYLLEDSAMRQAVWDEIENQSARLAALLQPGHDRV